MLPKRSVFIDAADLDGGSDVVIGEHWGEEKNQVLIFVNQNHGSNWTKHVIDSDSKNTIDYHDGTAAVDLDGDGDLDMISIGWYNPDVWVYESEAL